MGTWGLGFLGRLAHQFILGSDEGTRRDNVLWFWGYPLARCHCQYDESHNGCHLTTAHVPPLSSTPRRHHSLTRCEALSAQLTTLSSLSTVAMFDDSAPLFTGRAERGTEVDQLGRSR